jgi:predicted HD phosphohydrolase
MTSAPHRDRGASSGLNKALPVARRDVPARWAAADAARDLSALWRLVVDHGSREMVAPGISALDHALRCAALAQEAGADAELITASLLHDIGHLLLEDFCVASAPVGRDRHAMIGAAFLSLWFGPGITEPVRLHAEAKRYLCAVEPGYLDRLHRSARTSLERNGGPMSQDEIEAFLRGAHAREAILLRRWDDRANAEPLKSGAVGRFQKLAQRCLV